MIARRRAIEPANSYSNPYETSPSPAIGEPGVLGSGQYRVRVETDGQQRGFDHCRAGPTPAETVLIEIGNGVVSVEEGL